MTRSRLLVLLVSLVLGWGMVPSVAQAQPPGALRAGPGYHEPAVGSCYDLSWDQAVKPSATQDPVACDAPHTLMTVKVKRLSKPVNWSTDLSPRFEVPCTKAMYDAIGGTKLAAMSAYQLWFFMPTKEERAKGARWIRCDVGLRAGRTGMDRLPTSVTLASLPLAKSVARCLAGKTLATTACSNGHTWKAKKAFKLSSRATSEAQYQKQGRRCARLTNTQHYVFDGPSAEEWKAGNHWMVCFKRD